MSERDDIPEPENDGFLEIPLFYSEKREAEPLPKPFILFRPFVWCSQYWQARRARIKARNIFSTTDLPESPDSSDSILNRTEFFLTDDGISGATNSRSRPKPKSKLSESEGTGLSDHLPPTP